MGFLAIAFSAFISLKEIGKPFPYSGLVLSNYLTPIRYLPIVNYHIEILARLVVGKVITYYNPQFRRVVASPLPIPNSI